jgi:UDP-N-acetylglucosamine 4,6-dehydratase/5-epimerase
MPALKIKDLAEAIIQEYAPKFGKIPSDVKIDIIGKRHGEKLFEELIQDGEVNIFENEEMFIILPDYLYHGTSRKYNLPKSYRKVEKRRFSSDNAHFISREEIRSLIANELHQNI